MRYYHVVDASAQEYWIIDLPSTNPALVYAHAAMLCGIGMALVSALPLSQGLTLTLFAVLLGIEAVLGMLTWRLLDFKERNRTIEELITSPRPWWRGGLGERLDARIMCRPDWPPQADVCVSGEELLVARRALTLLSERRADDEDVDTPRDARPWERSESSRVRRVFEVLSLWESTGINCGNKAPEFVALTSDGLRADFSRRTHFSGSDLLVPKTADVVTTKGYLSLRIPVTAPETDS